MAALTLEEIAQTIRRVRFGEVGFDGKDVKAVWHQGTEFDERACSSPGVDRTRNAG